MKFRKKSIVIEAFCWEADAPVTSVPNWFYEACITRVVYPELDGTCSIKTLEGIMTAQRGDWIIQGIGGALYPCMPAIFEATYEKVV